MGTLTFFLRMASTTTTTTTTTTPKTKSKSSKKKRSVSKKKDDDDDSILKSKKANEFWEKHFGDQERVSCKAFRLALISFFKTQKIENEAVQYHLDKVSMEIFSKQLVPRIFSSASDPAYVDLAAVQFVIDTFGPWNKVFQNIYINFEDGEQPHKPFQYFHGRCPKSKMESTISPPKFALRYAKLAKGGLTLSWSQNGTPKHSRLIRKKIKGEPPRWHFNEKIPGVGTVKTQINKFDKVGEFIDYMKERNAENIKIPLMFASGYDSVVELPTHNRIPTNPDFKKEVDKHFSEG